MKTILTEHIENLHEKLPFKHVLAFELNLCTKGSPVAGTLLGSPGENVAKLGTILPLSYDSLWLNHGLLFVMPFLLSCFNQSCRCLRGN